MAFATTLAQTAGQILLTHFRSAHLERRFKADHTIVTSADLEANAHIQAAIAAAYPEDGIISEEAGTTWKGEEVTWIIDPLDGTANFQWGLPIWGVSIARWVAGKPSLGVIHFPALGETFAARRGNGVTRNGEALRKTNDLPMNFLACCSRTHQRYEVNLPYKTRILGAVTYNMIQVASGNAALNLEVTPKLWDVAAGWPIVEECGGVVAVINGTSPVPLQMNIDYAQLHFSTLTAGNTTLLAEGRQGLRLRLP
ncbi:MAG: inositol monophosphatase family protein [Anaerolineales bacterium]